MRSRATLATVGLVACLALGCNQGKPVPGVKGLPKWEPEPAEGRLAEFTKSLDTWAAQIARAENATLPHDKHLDAMEVAIDEFDRVSEHLMTVKKDVESAIGSVHSDPERHDRYRDQAKKEAGRFDALLDRFGKLRVASGDAGKKEKDGK
jgi:hypothetical protein